MKKLALSSLIFALAWLGGAGSAQAAVGVKITSPTTAQTLPVKTTLKITAGVTGTTKTGVTWSVNGVPNGNSTYGTITGSGLTVTYNAPSKVPSPATFKITATSTADVSKSASLSVTVSAGVVVAMTTPTGAQHVLVSTSLGFTASISGTSNTGVTWSVNGVTNGNSTYGTISGSGLSVTYHAPAAVPSPDAFVVKATSTEDDTKSASISVTITTAAEVTVAITHPANPASVAVGSTLAITAAVTNAEPALTWTINGVASPTSTFGSITGTYPAFTFKPPSAIPGGSNPVTIEATEAGTSKSASLTVTIDPSASLPTAIHVPGGTDVSGINFSLTPKTPTLALDDIGGPCTGSLTPTPNFTCTAGVASVTVSPGASSIVWVIGEGLTNGSDTAPALASGLAVSVSQGNPGDVTVSELTPLVDTTNGLTDIAFLVTVTAGAAPGPRNLIVTNPAGQVAVYVGGIIIE